MSADATLSANPEDSDERELVEAANLRAWQESNARQLSASLARLRARLEKSRAHDVAAPIPAIDPAVAAAAPMAIPAPATPAGSTTSRVLFERMLGGATAEKAEPPAPVPTVVVAASPASPAPAPASPLVPAPAAAAAPEPVPPSALDILGQQLGLSPFEKDLLLLCAGMELDTRFPALCASAQDDQQKPFPTFALALATLDEPAWDVLSNERPLRFFRLIELAPGGPGPLTATPLRIDERILHFLKGLNHLDERLAAFCLPPDAAPGVLAETQTSVAESIARELEQSWEKGVAPFVQLLGPDAEARWLIAQAAARRLGRHIYRVPAEALPAQPAELDALARLWQRESLLRPLALYLEAQELDGAPAEKIEPLARFLTRSGSLVLLGIREPFARTGGRPALHFDVVKPTPAEQQAAWTAALGSAANAAPARLAGQFDLNLAGIRAIAKVAARAGKPDTVSDKAWALCCARERPRLDALAQRLEPKVTRADLVLPAPELQQLEQIAAQVKQRRRVYGDWGFGRKMNRGLGIGALFAGPSGTGKTMAAEVLASELQLNLYRIDLSAVVSKYIGETEKNLRRLFDAAESGGAILFFDEADALFGKRSEVKDSHDRYANIEINYLLQRIESYRGLAILATNMKSALDPAFLRRLRFIVNFPLPAAKERRQMWEQVFPRADAAKQQGGVPTGTLDFERLARLNLTGGHIQNVALHAAFLAAAAQSSVTMPLILQAAQTEYQKLQRPINAADFAWPEPKANGRPQTPVQPAAQRA